MSYLPKILIVEDEGLIARDIELHLLQFGFPIAGVAQTAAEAFSLIEQQRPDLVLMDIRIGGETDGIEAAQTIQRCYELPLIFLTAHADDATLEQAKQAGPLGYIRKPFQEVDLKTTITMAWHQFARERERKRLSQEQQLFLAGEFALAVAQPFYHLFDQMGDYATEMNATAHETLSSLLQRASQTGKNMSLQLMEFREAYGEAHQIDVRSFLFELHPTLERLVGVSLCLECFNDLDLGSVLITGTHLQQLLLHLLLAGRHHLGRPDRMVLSADVQSQMITPNVSRCFVRFRVRDGRNAAKSSTVSPLVTERSHPGIFNLDEPILRLIATALGGVLRTSPDLTTGLEVLLPQQEPLAESLDPGKGRVILLIGFQPRLVAAIRRATGTESLLLEAASLDEALSVAEWYPHKIDLIITNELPDSDGLPKARNVSTCLCALRPDAAYLQFSSTNDGQTNSLNPSDLVRELRLFFAGHNGRHPPRHPKSNFGPFSCDRISPVPSW